MRPVLFFKQLVLLLKSSNLNFKIEKLTSDQCEFVPQPSLTEWL